MNVVDITPTNIELLNLGMNDPENKEIIGLVFEDSDTKVTLRMNIGCLTVLRFIITRRMIEGATVEFGDLRMGDIITSEDPLEGLAASLTRKNQNLKKDIEELRLTIETLHIENELMNRSFKEQLMEKKNWTC